jgi:bifunctional non-homologous end joining protein LigD
MSSTKTSKRVGRRTLQISNFGKVLFPQIGLTKGKLIDYYEHVSPLMVPHLKNRPLTLRRYPDGVESFGFYQKDASGHFPEWIRTENIQKEDGTLNQVLCNDPATLLYLVGQAAIEFHIWTSKVDRIEKPDQIVFDFDPPDDGVFGDVKKAAKAMKNLLENLGLSTVIKTTGSRGLHVIAPIKRELPYEGVRSFADRVAILLAEQDPKKLTIEVRKNKRMDRIFIDVGRNAYAQHAVAPYSVRAKTNAPVATPIDWSELSNSKLRADTFTAKTVLKRISDDPWADWNKKAGSVKGALKRLPDA